MNLIAAAIIGIAVIVLLIAACKVHPFLSLLAGSFVMAVCAGVPFDKAFDSFTSGVGGTISNVGLLIAFGSIIGTILFKSGGADTIVDTIMAKTPLQRLPWAMALIAFIVGIPMFFEVGLVVLLPLIFSVARKLETRERFRGSAYIYVGVPVIAALAAMHGMVPPHPGPLTAIATLKTVIGPTMLYGFVAAVTAIVLGGPLYAQFLTPRMTVRPDEALLEQFTHAPGPASTGSQPGAALGIFTVLLPALLMLVHTLAETLLPKGAPVARVAAFLGNPLIAMLIGVLFACTALVYARGGDTKRLRESLGASLKPIAGILLIIAGGGAFQQVLTDVKVGDAIVHLTQHFALPPLALGWTIAMLLSVSTGSATVGIVGAAGLLAPLAGADPTLNLPLLALSIGCGSLFFNYANHAGFWLVKESFGMTMGEATKTISVVQSIVALVGLAMVLLMNLLPALG